MQMPPLHCRFSGRDGRNAKSLLEYGQDVDAKSERASLQERKKRRGEKCLKSDLQNKRKRTR